MVRRQAARLFRLGTWVALSTPPNPDRSTYGFHDQYVRLFLMPLEPPFCPVNVQLQVVPSPAATRDTNSAPRGPHVKRSSTASSRLPRLPPFVKVVRSAQTAPNSSPVTVAVKFSACKPTPRVPAAPARAGSFFHTLPSPRASHPWWYSTKTFRTVPNCPEWTKASSPTTRRYAVQPSPAPKDTLPFPTAQPIDSSGPCDISVCRTLLRLLGEMR